MAWLDEALPVFRVVIGDDDCDNQIYCDTRLSDILVAVAKLLVSELSFDACYTVTVSTSTISPDPSDDPFFIPLLVLKAATKIASSEYKASASSAGSVSDGPSTINLGGIATALKVRLDTLQKDYDKARLQYSLGNAIGCLAVMSECVDSYKYFYIENCCYPRYRR